MAGEAQTIQAKVYVPGKGPGSKLQRQLTFDMISEWIRLQGLDEYTTKGLIELAGKYPTQALPAFRKNFNLMIQRVRAKRKQEQAQLIEEVVTEIGQPTIPSVEEVQMDDWQNKEMEKSNGEGKGIGGGGSKQHDHDEASGNSTGSAVIYA